MIHYMNKTTKEQSIATHKEVNRLFEMGKYRQKEIAGMVGISPKTVSWILRNNPEISYKYGDRNFRISEPYRRLRIKALEMLGNKCIKCGFSDVRALQIDHINGGGWDARKKGITGYKLCGDVLKNPSLYQCLCANCNWIKRYENHEVKTTDSRRYK